MSTASVAATSSTALVTTDPWKSRMTELHTLVTCFRKLPGNNKVLETITPIVNNLLSDKDLSKNIRMSLKSFDATVATMRTGTAYEATTAHTNQLNSLIFGVVTFVSKTFPRKQELAKLTEYVSTNNVEGVQSFVEGAGPFADYVPVIGTTAPNTQLTKGTHVNLYGLAAISGAIDVQEYLKTANSDPNTCISPVQKKVPFSMYPSMMAAARETPSLSAAQRYRVVKQCLKDGADPLISSGDWLSLFIGEISPDIMHLMLSHIDNISRANSNEVNGNLLHHAAKTFVAIGNAQKVSGEAIEDELQIARMQKYSQRASSAAQAKEIDAKEKNALIEEKYSNILKNSRDLRRKTKKDSGLADCIRDNCRQEIEGKERENAKINWLIKWHARFRSNAAIMIYHSVECPEKVRSQVDSATWDAASNCDRFHTDGVSYIYFGSESNGIPLVHPHTLAITERTTFNAKKIYDEEQSKFPSSLAAIKSAVRDCFLTAQDPNASSDLATVLTTLIINKLDPRVMLADFCKMRTHPEDGVAKWEG